MNNKQMLSGLALLCAALLTQSASASSCNPCEVKREHRHHYRHDDKHPFFVTVGAGASWAASNKIEVPHVTTATDTKSFWDGANEGYDHNRGTSEFYTVALGYHWNRWLSTFAELTNRPSYHYRKDQTVQASNGTNTNVNGLEALGNKTRNFELKNTTITFNFDLRFGGFFDCCGWEISRFYITPIVGAGIGVAYNRVENFHSVANGATGVALPFAGRTGYVANDGTGAGHALSTADADVLGIGTGAPGVGTDDNVLGAAHYGANVAAGDIVVLGRNGAGATTFQQAHSIMLDRTKTDFTWQVKVGFAVAYKRVSFDIFYRYNDSGHFKSHNYTVDAPENYFDPLVVPQWKGNVAAHELCFNCNKKF